MRAYQVVTQSDRALSHLFTDARYPKMRVVNEGASVFLCLVFVVGVVGNAFVCGIVYTVRNMRNATNLILVNMAVADIIAALLSVPLMIATFLMNEVDYATIQRVSKVHFVLTVGAGAPLVFCHLLLCVDRYDSVIHPFRKRITKSRLKRISAFIWGTATLLSAAAVVVVTVAPVPWFLDERIDEDHFLVLSQIFDGISLTVIVVTLVCILESFVLVRRALHRHSHNVTRSLGRVTLEKEVQLSSAAVMSVTSFALTSLPWLIARFLHFTTTHQSEETFMLCYAAMHTSHAVNPLVYAGYIRTFRRAVKVRVRGMLVRPLGCFQGAQIHPGLPPSHQ